MPNILDVLSEAAVEEEWLLAAGSNYVFLVRMVHEAAGEGYAVYKPQRGEAPLHDFPGGTLYRREYAAYLVSEALGWGLVPPTVVREQGLSAGVGALQLFIVHDPALHYFSLKDERPDELRRVAVFDWLTNNADRKGGHCLVDANGRLWCIDHGITFHADNKLRTVIWDYQGTEAPAELVDDVRRFGQRLRDDPQLRGRLKELLLPRELEALMERAELIDRVRTFPSPPAYRPYPWPMI